jgi:curved DNA-binding protein CbpA
MPAPEPNGRHYRRLEVGPNASPAEIVHAYRRLAQDAHPDRHPDDPEAPRRFREITEAYEALSEPVRDSREARDQGAGTATPIPVVVRPASDPNYSDWTRGRDDPFVLGARAQATQSPLRAGPVRIDPDGQDRGSGQVDPGEVGDGGLFRLFFDLFEAFGRF